MILLAVIEDLYFISHCARKSNNEMLFVCSTDFLSVNVFNHIHLLAPSTQSNSQPFFLETSLTMKQDKEAAIIFQKLNKEKQSGYVFTEQLQRTYLMEIVHLITRVHGKNALVKR